MMNKNSKSKQLLDKVYNHLDTIDITRLSMNELKDFLEVVQKGQFLESFGSISALSPNPYGWGSNQAGYSLGSTESGEKTESTVD